MSFVEFLGGVTKMILGVAGFVACGLIATSLLMMGELWLAGLVMVGGFVVFVYAVYMQQELR